MYRQYDLRHNDERLTCWLNDSRLREGMLVKLKHDREERYWEIIRAWKVEMDTPPEQRWQIGGIL